MPYPCCGPHCSVCRMSMSSVSCSSSIRFLYWCFSFIDVDTLLAVAVDCLLPHHGGASIQSRAYRNSSDEIGIRLTFRSKQSALWPADPRGWRGGCEPAGKTCYLPRFHIMHRPAMLSGQT